MILRSMRQNSLSNRSICFEKKTISLTSHPKKTISAGKTSPPRYPAQPQTDRTQLLLHRYIGASFFQRADQAHTRGKLKIVINKIW